MAKTAIVTTYHKALSYGGCLQAYATLLVLRDAGYDPRFLDYENPYEARKKSFASVVRRGSLTEIASTLAKDLVFKGRSYRQRAFGTFSASLPLTDRSYASVDEAQDVSADVFVVGSDQVWNPDITNGFESAFLLDFGDAGKRISLASSMGSHRPSEEEGLQLAAALRRFDAISVREVFAKEALAGIVDKDVRVMLDPTLLVDAPRWRALASPAEGFVPGKYILLFMVASDPHDYEGLVAQVRDAYRLPVVQVRLNSSRPRGTDVSYPATPFEFVWLVDNAAFVVTDSFHGLAFSINLETPFICLPNRGNNVRLEELLRLCDMEQRQVLDGDGSGVIGGAMDFSDARDRLAARRSADIAWLKGALDDGE